MKNQNKSPRQYFVVFFLSIFYLTMSAQVTWDGGGDGTNWNDPLNWDSNVVPLSTEDVVLPMGSNVVISSVTNAVARVVTINDAALTVLAGGTLSIDGTGTIIDAFQLDNSDVINDGIITVTMASGNGIFLDNASLFTNNGIISVDNSQTDGLQLSSSTPGSSFINNGTLNFDNDGGEPIKLEENGYFRNSDTGIINIENDTEEGIHLDNAGAEFLNEGDIFLNSAGESGIELDEGSLFTNASSGYIRIGNMGLNSADSDAIDLDGAPFINDGTIEVFGANLVENGISLIDADGIPSSFVNNGFITIEDILERGIQIEGASTFTNNLLINVGLSATPTGDVVMAVLDGSLINSACGVINMTSNNYIIVFPDGSIVNEGIMTTVYTEDHSNDGSFTNNGEIATPDGNFIIEPNAVIGTGSITMGEIPRQPLDSCLPVAIPTMGEWGLAILGLIMGIFGVVWMRSRERVFVR